MPLNLSPPLLNSSSPWATTLGDLQALYDCPHTGAVSTRTSLLREGFQHDEKVHQHVFFDAADGGPPSKEKAKPGLEPKAAVTARGISSLNTLGYSPSPLSEYCCMVQTVVSTARARGGAAKPFILSVTGTAEEVSLSYELITTTARGGSLPLHMEVNLSCPNIAGKPPPAYDTGMLSEYLRVLGKTKEELLERAVRPRQKATHATALPLVGIKTPPYTYMGQFEGLIAALVEAAQVCGGCCPVDFITATNTLGSCLVVSPGGIPELNSEAGTGIGGMAGAGLHPLSVGNVATIRRLLDQWEELKGVEIIGVGGVADREGYRRMRSVGAAAVGIATALGREGVDVFGRILEEHEEGMG